MVDQPRDLEREPVEALTSAILVAVGEHFRSRPQANATTCEVLNALASAAALVLAGTSNDPRAVQFFLDALNTNIALQRDEPPTTIQ